jgi:hypothetical protein
MKARKVRGTGHAARKADIGSAVGVPEDKTQLRNRSVECKMGVKQVWRKDICNRLGGVVVSVLATGPNSRGFKPGRGD